MSGHTKKRAKSNKKMKKLDLMEEIKEIRIKYFTGKKNKRASNDKKF